MNRPIFRVLASCGQALVICIGVASFGWMCNIHVAYFATLDHKQFEDNLGRPMIEEYLWPELFVPFVPLALWNLRDRLPSWPLFGALGGLAVGMWFNVLLLTIPPLGIYPSLPAVPASFIFSRGQGMDAGASFIVPTLIINLVLWTSIGSVARKLGTVVGVFRAPIPTVRPAP